MHFSRILTSSGCFGVLLLGGSPVMVMLLA
jgi:hypothetical protein